MILLLFFMEKKISEISTDIAAEPDRRMAFVAKVTHLEPIKGADKIELATVLGWKVICKKEEFKLNDLCIYYTLSSLLDSTNPYFDFLKDKSGEMLPLKTKRLKGVLSQGLITPISLIKHYGKDPAELKEGEDLTSIMKIKKFVPKDEATVYVPKIGEKVMQGYPSYIPKTDEERIQNIPHIFEKIKGKEVVITRKEDGTSGTYVYMNGNFMICSRNYVRPMPTPEEAKDPKKCDFYIQAERKFEICKNMTAFKKNLGIQGEIVGPGIGKNRLLLKELDFRVFNIYLIDEKRYAIYEEMLDICEKLKLHSVPLIYKGIFKEELGSVEKILAYAETVEYAKNVPGEGLVLKTNELGSRISFKAVSNKYLLKHGE